MKTTKRYSHEPRDFTEYSLRRLAKESEDANELFGFQSAPGRTRTFDLLITVKFSLTVSRSTN